jgi:DNA/RNA endonuclease YhcR with UshA esterase domain
MNAWRVLFGTAVAAVLIMPSVAAQVPTGTGKGTPNYDRSTEITVTGTVEQVRQLTQGSGWGGTHLTLKTDNGTLDVHLGPSSFLAGQHFSFATGDRIEVTGSKVKVDGTDALLAREVRKDGKVLTLRDPNGIPKWSRGQRRD